MAEDAEVEALSKGIEVQPLGTSIAAISLGAAIPVLGSALIAFIGSSLTSHIAKKK